MAAIAIGALLIIVGVIWAAGTTAQRGRLSDLHSTVSHDAVPTLEPGGQGRRLSFKAELPAFCLIVAGAALIFAGSLD